MDDLKVWTEMVEQDTSRDSESDCDIPSDFDICPCESELEKLPEVLLFIKRLQSFIHRQQSKLDKIRKKLIEHKSKRRKKHHVATQTESRDDTDSQVSASWNSERTNKEVEAWGGERTDKEVEVKQSLAEQVKEAAQSAMQLTGFVYEETSGMYYDYNTGYYYNAELGLYYDGNSGTYYYYDDKSKVFQFHSQVEATLRTTSASSCDISYNTSVKPEEQESKRRVKHESTKIEEEVDELMLGLSQLSVDQCRRHALELSKAWPPCIRIIVKETNIEHLKLGSLFMVTCTGGTLGREGDHAVSITDINISKHHAVFTFDETLGKYYVTDFGSRNGTHLNGKRLSAAKQESEPHEIIHGSMLQVGTTKLLCHIHAGRETCGHCEPGLVQKQNSATGDDKTGNETKKYSHKKELRRIRKKFGLESSEPNMKAISVPGYEDRAQIRRSTFGSQDHHEKTQAASLEEPIQSDNKGFKLLTKMGWSEGQALGKDGDGCLEPFHNTCAIFLLASLCFSRDSSWPSSQ